MPSVDQAPERSGPQVHEGPGELLPHELARYRQIQRVGTPGAMSLAPADVRAGTLKD